MKWFIHTYLMRNKLVSVYLRGSYCTMEIDIYPIKRAIQIWCHGVLAAKHKVINILKTV